MRLALALVLVLPGVASSQACPSGTPEAVPFAPGTSDPNRLFHGALTPDGREFWFFKKVGADLQAEEYRLFRAVQRGDGWGDPAQVTIGVEASDLYPAFTPDGKRLVFASYRRAPGDTLAHPNASLWVVERQGAGFGEPRPISALARPGDYFSQLGVQPDGSLQYRRTLPDWRTTESWLSAPQGTTWGAPVPDSLVNRWMGWRPETLRVWGGERSPDGNAVVLEIADRDPVNQRPTQTDLWVSVLRDGVWLEPKRLGPSVNDAEATDNFAFFSPDGCTLLWTRNFSRFMAIDWGSAVAGALQQQPR